MHLIQTIILGVVEGITEFLPISSTAHLIFTAKILHLPATDFLKSFEIAIQFGAILAVLVLYAPKILASRNLFLKIATAFIPTGIIGFLLYKLIKNVFLESLVLPLIMLGVGGVLILIFEYYFTRRQQTETKKLSNTTDTTMSASNSVSVTSSVAALTYKQAVIIGTVQALAVVPGVSRSAATIMGGMALNISRQTIVEFSFLLAIPTMMAATSYDLYKNAGILQGGNIALLLVGALFAFVTALFSLRFLLKYVRHHSFLAFGIYRIIAAIIGLLIIFL